MKPRILFYFLLIPILFLTLSLKSNSIHRSFYSVHLFVLEDNTDSLFKASTLKLYDSCQLNKNGLSFSVFEKGITGFYNLRKMGIGSAKNILTIIDFQKPSKEKRLWIIDLKQSKLLFYTLVAHGKNTGNEEAICFSNTPNSLMSSLGFYRTENTYMGKHGLSLVLDGLDKGINSNAKERAIVMHGADYVCEEFVQCNGRLGRSHGCPALPEGEHKEIINLLEGGTILFAYHPSLNNNSIFLNKKDAISQYMTENFVKK